MENPPIYIENIELPVPKDQLADHILAEASAREKITMSLFAEPFSDIDFIYLKVPEKEDRVMKAIADLKKAYQFHATWKDSGNLRSELNGMVEIAIHHENDSYTISAYQYEVLIQHTAELMFLDQKKKFLISLLKKVSKENIPGIKRDGTAGSLEEDKNLVRKELKNGFEQQSQSSPQEDQKQFPYLSRMETAACLKISLDTLWAWTKDGKLKSYKIGRRVLYKIEEIDKALKEQPKYVRK